MRLSRRTLLGSGALIAASPAAAWARDLAAGSFTHGVASGDPLPDGVVIWTRFLPTRGRRIAWEVASDESFAHVVRRGEDAASAADDFCVKVDVRGLAPGRRYLYRFLSASGPSLTGETRTAPEAIAAEPLAAALFSCANFAFGYFHAYGHAAPREDIDLVLHVGDYIYEYEHGGYPGANEAIAERVIEPARETVRLADYYQRYATYHTDPNLLELRRRKPISTVWDDHELANDANAGGAQNHQRSEGDYADRIAAASKAYFDWMPIRRPTARGARLYRALDWGALARIILLDTRYIGRDRPPGYRTALAGVAQGGAEAAAALSTFRDSVLNDPSRALLGAEQEAWLQRVLAESKRRGHTWQIIAQQVPFAAHRFPAGLSRLLPDGASSNTRRWIASGEQAGALGMPWNLGAWAGYPAAGALPSDARRARQQCRRAGRRQPQLLAQQSRRARRRPSRCGRVRRRQREFARVRAHALQCRRRRARSDDAKRQS